MTPKISKFSVYGLFGSTDVEIEISDNKLLLVGENGTGKTTIVNLFYYFLSMQWKKMSELDFERATLKISGKNISVSKNDLTYRTRFREVRREMPRSIYTWLETKSPEELERFSSMSVSALANELRKDFPSPTTMLQRRALDTKRFIDLFRDQLQLPLSNADELAETEEFLREKIDIRIIYLPTFRRIEKELSTLIPNLEEHVRRYEHQRRRGHGNSEYIELVEFGMDDVVSLLRRKRQESLETATAEFENLAGQFLHDVINGTANQFAESSVTSLSDSYIDSVLARVQERTLASEDKQKIRDFVHDIRTTGKAKNEDQKRIGYLFGRILEAAKKVEKQEEDILRLTQLCNKYFYQKRLIYDRGKYELSIQRPSGAVVELKDLSSGEKQIFSLFCHLLLNDEKEFMLIIDEPELSLSVNWQLQFLPDLISVPGCKFMAAVTHSPFIFDNSLDEYAQDLADLVVER